MGRAIARVIAVFGGLVFSFWTGATFLLDNIGRAETLADLAHRHHDLVKWLVSTPPAYPGVGALAIAGVLCYLLLAGPQSSPPASAHFLAPHPSHDLAPREAAPLVVQPQRLEATVPSQPSPAKPVKPPDSESDRIYVDLPMVEITKPFREHTSLTAERLFDVYKGKWLRIEGTVRNISRMGDSEMNVSLNTEAPLYAVSLYFDRPWFERV